MFELKDHKIYDMLKHNYQECYLDYVIFQSEEEYSKMESHKLAVIKAFEILNERKQKLYKVGEFKGYDIQLDKMAAELITTDEFFEEPEDSYYMTKPSENRCFSIPEKTPYWYAFLEPPYTNTLVLKDFQTFNQVLFPFKNNLELYRWNDDFSNYFDDGKEWWGTGCWSVYDKIEQIYVVILVSLTD